ncbi:hypothetical protein EDD18DRAFT_1360974 [Armillaria luteobubalina]|uniref:Uncharacterized protein n=1 Tax=Armillaria luteobubalina TaxID=153913 RepID=A0AA39PJM7_9AGAR|nr:hypothetical protein EDD18DRAFT_1360974 [Armillaria luteobubalina]
MYALYAPSTPAPAPAPAPTNPAYSPPPSNIGVPASGFSTCYLVMPKLLQHEIVEPGTKQAVTSNFFLSFAGEEEQEQEQERRTTAGGQVGPLMNDDP